LQRKELDPILGGGYVAYCSPTGTCHRASSVSIKVPNGLVYGVDRLIYVPSSIDGKVRVFSLSAATKMLELVNTIELGMPLDNLAVDANGDMWVPGFPDAWSFMRWLANPLEEAAASTLMRVSEIRDWNRDEVRTTEYIKAKYKVDKMLEDREMKVVSGITTVRHDVKTGRLFMGSKLFGHELLEELADELQVYWMLTLWSANLDESSYQ